MVAVAHSPGYQEAVKEASSKRSSSKKSSKGKSASKAAVPEEISPAAKAQSPPAAEAQSSPAAPDQSPTETPAHSLPPAAADKSSTTGPTGNPHTSTPKQSTAQGQSSKTSANDQVRSQFRVFPPATSSPTVPGPSRYPRIPPASQNSEGTRRARSPDEVGQEPEQPKKRVKRSKVFKKPANKQRKLGVPRRRS